MKLTAQKDITLDDDYIDIKYREFTPVIHQIFQLCEDTGATLLCEKDDATYRVDISDILYIEAVDRKSYVYTTDNVYTMPTPLTQLEETLAKRHFIRISRMTLVNVYKVKSVSNGLHYRLTAEMMNGEKIIITRHYRSILLDAIQALAKEVAK